MADYKDLFLQQAEVGLAAFLGEEDLSQSIGVLTRLLKNYEVTTAARDLIPCPGINEKLLNRFCACLAISGRSPGTIAGYRRTAEKLAALTGKTFIDTGVYDIRLFLAEEKSRGVSNQTLENNRANLSAFFSWLLQEDHITKNPCMNITPIKCPEKVRLPFSAVEIDALRFACKNTKERALVELLLATGIRVSELTGLRLSDVNFAELSVHVRKGKGSKERTVYFTELAKTHLEAYIQGRGPIMDDTLFLNRCGTAIAPGGVRHVLHELGKRAGVDNVHPHRFRRTFATSLAGRGMDIQEIRKLLGHSNLDTTLQYVYTSDEKAHASYLRFSA